MYTSLIHYISVHGFQYMKISRSSIFLKSIPHCKLYPLLLVDGIGNNECITFWFRTIKSIDQQLIMNQKRLTYSVLTKLVQNKISVKLAKILLYVLSKFVELLLIEIN